MQGVIKGIHESLQELIGLHRQLLDTVRLEKDALVSADVKSIQDVTVAKESLIAAIQQAELFRFRRVAELAAAWLRPMSEMTLSKIAIEVQRTDLAAADLLRSSLTTLTLLVERIAEQNGENRTLVESSLQHVSNMKANVLGESDRASSTYAQDGQRTGPSGRSRLISREA